MTDGENSYNCQEGSRFPSADNYLYFPTNITYCQEGAEMLEKKEPIHNKLEERNFWTELVKDYLAGMSLPSCEKKYGISRIGITRCLIRNNIKVRPIKEALHLHYKTLLKNGGHGNGWKGGRHVNSIGYVDIQLSGNVRRREHILIAEKILGRRLRKGECIHHINGIKSDNTHNNLLICISRSIFHK